MNITDYNTGYIVFGYDDGFTVYDSLGCAKDFEDSEYLKSVLVDTIKLELESMSLNEMNILLLCSRIIELNNYYVFYSMYFRSQDNKGRTAYQGVALLLKNSTMSASEIYKNLDILGNHLNRILSAKEIKSLKLHVTSLVNTNNHFTNKILTNRYFINLDLPKKIIDFVEITSVTNVYKIYASKKNPFLSSSVKVLDESFLKNPDSYFKIDKKTDEEVKDILPVEEKQNSIVQDIISVQDLAVNFDDALNEVKVIQSHLDSLLFKLEQMKLQLTLPLPEDKSKKKIDTFNDFFKNLSIEKIKILVLLSIFLLLFVCLILIIGT